MARVLMGWELGAGHGHVVNMMTVARALRERGHEVVLALKEVGGTWTVTRGEFPIVQAPLSRLQPIATVPGRRFLARSFADILVAHGYANPMVLEPYVRSWRALLDLVRPDLVLAEFAPGLCMAAFGREPCVSFGIGFCAPCLQGKVFPVLEPKAEELLPLSRLNDGLADVLRRLGRTPPANPLSTVLGDRQLALGFAELDAYRAARKPPLLGPMWELPQEDLPLPATPACLAYLPEEHPAIRQLVAGLVQLNMPGVVYVRGASPETLAALRRGRLEVALDPVDLKAVLPQVSVVIHHAGTGTVERCMAWGRPQVMSPIVLEQGMTTRTLIQMGVAIGAGDAASVAILPQLVEQAHAPAIRAAAQQLAVDLRSRDQGNSLPQVIDIALGLIA